MKNSMQESSLSLASRIQGLGEWFHNLNLNGIATAPHHFLGDFPRVKWERFSKAISDNLEGKTVLDIGCNASFYAVEMKRRGASRVVAIDHDERYLAQARLVAEVNNSSIEFHHLSVYDVGQLKETFDTVLFLGVFYHLRHPLLVLELIHQHVTRDLFIFQSMIRGSKESFRPAANYSLEEEGLFLDSKYPSLFL